MRPLLVVSTILPSCTHIKRRFSTQSADIFGHESAVRQLWTICGHKSISFLQLLGPAAHALSKYTHDDDTSRVFVQTDMFKHFVALHSRKAPKSFVSYAYVEIYASDKSLEFHISKVVSLLWDPTFWGMLLAQQHLAG